MYAGWPYNMTKQSTTNLSREPPLGSLSGRTIRPTRFRAREATPPPSLTPVKVATLPPSPTLLRVGDTPLSRITGTRDGATFRTNLLRVRDGGTHPRVVSPLDGDGVTNPLKDIL